MRRKLAWLTLFAFGSLAFADAAAASTCTPPGIPEIYGALPAGAGTILVAWQNGSPSSAMFQVYRASGSCSMPGAFTPLSSSTSTFPFGAQSTADTTAAAGATYSYYVTGLDAGCESAPSGCVDATEGGAGFSFFSLVGCRVVDTRFPIGPGGGPPLQPAVNRPFQVAGTCGVPFTAKLVVLTAKVIPAPSVSGPVSVLFGFSVLISTPGITPPSVFGVAPLSSIGQAWVSNNLMGGPAHLILDVFGYFE